MVRYRCRSCDLLFERGELEDLASERDSPPVVDSNGERYYLGKRNGGFSCPLEVCRETLDSLEEVREHLKEKHHK